MFGQVIFSALAFATAAATAAGAALGLRPTLKRTSNAVQEIHVMVNGRLSAALARVEQLTRTLADAGVPVPPSSEDPAPSADGEPQP
jgi:hypothetical protein